MVTRRHGLAAPFGLWRDDMDRVLADFLRGLPGQFSAAGLVQGRSFPAVNVWETEGELYAECEVPGLSQADLHIFVVGNELTIKGQRNETESERNVAYHRRERGVGSFTRVVHLPTEVDSNRVSAALTDGVLLITLPKSEAAKPRKIQVTSGNA